AELPAAEPALLEYLSIMTAFGRLAPSDERDPTAIAERMREQIVAKRRLATLLADAPAVRAAIDAALARFNGTVGEPRSFDALDALLAAQNYRLSFFRTAAEEINYRRFFAINDLAAIRQEEQDVFAATHEALLSLIASGAATGVRIDHPDGLWEPAGYTRQLQAAAAQALAGASDPEWTPQPPTLDAGAGGEALPLYLVVEKILEPGEELPADWAVQGTVGYEFARVATGLFVDQANRKAFDDLYARYLGNKIDYADLVYRSKQLMMRVALASETNVLAQALNRISEQDRRTRDFTLNSLRDALRDAIASFPVYRTYVVCGETPVSDRDRRSIEAAVAAAKRRNPASDPSVFDFLRDVLLLESGPEVGAAEQAERCRFAMKFQQLTGPVMAKGVEDTAFYIYNRLISLNEVGGDPAIFGVGPEQFHRHNAGRRRRWPHELLASSTHDTKRSEDVRARIDVLSEMPRDWRAALNRWTRLNRRHRGRVEGASAPARNDEYLFYQTLLGAWPFGSAGSDAEFVDRIDAFMLKAVREAQVHTSWINPNEAYETALRAFVRGVLGEGQDAFFDDFAALRQTVAHLGAFNALAQQLLKLSAPGVPDIYQGTELWDFSLVDPDNRRPVDYESRAHALAALRKRRPSAELAAELLVAKADGRIKLYLTDRALACRAGASDLFRDGDYRPLHANGPRHDHVVAFARRLGEREIVAAVPRLVASIVRGEEAPIGKEVWGDDALILPAADADVRFRDRFTDVIVTARPGPGGAALPLADIFAAFPAALLERIDAAADVGGAGAPA
ncbi:MAG TPA: malto-oligosyltrehalose synthase, partial [Thermomicrobiales bacterium]|nr:malto-oligosyltrehalose synthase [Thermomicrobiales bacterium]